MSGGLRGEEAKARVTRAVRAVEARTCAELVVALRAASGSTLHVDLLVGFVCAQISLILILFLPQPFRLETIPVDLGLFFALGALASSRLPWHRVLSRRVAREARTLAAARSAFFELGVGRTRTRCGILIFASLRERCVAIVGDVGVDVAKLPMAELQRALDPPRIDDFVAAIEALADPLALSYPRQADDVNELADEAQT